MSFNVLEFESEALSVRVCSLFLKDEICLLEQRLKEMSDSDLDLCLLFSHKPIPEDLDGSDWFPGVFVEKTFSFLGNPKNMNFVFSLSFPSKYGLKSVEGKACKKFLKLASRSEIFSWVKRDPSMTLSQFEVLSRKWTKAMFLRKTCDEVFAAFSNEEPVGLVALKIELLNGRKTGRVVLIAADEEHNEVVETLLQRAVMWCSEKEVDMEFSLPSTNEILCDLMKRMNMKQQSETWRYHAWLPVRKYIRSNVPYVTFREQKNLMQMLKSKQIESAGPFTARCQQWIEETLGTKKALLVGSATSALDQAAILCECGPGDEVIMPSYTFVSTANAFVLRGATPVFVEIREDSLNMDETKIEAAITERTKVIVVVHYAGMPCEMDTIMEIARRRGLLVVEDAAQAFLSTYQGRYLGTIGDLGCVSFHYTKNVIAGEGGALLVNTERFLDRSVIVWEKGTNRYDFIQKKVDKYCWVDIGSSFVPNECMSAFLLAQLDEAFEMTEKRVRICKTFEASLAALVDRGKFKMLKTGEGYNCHIFWIIFHSEEERSNMQRKLHDLGVQCFSHYMPLHSAPAGLKFGKVADPDMENTKAAGSCLIRLPVWADMTWQTVYKVISSMYKIFDELPPKTKEVKSMWLCKTRI